ncbi:HPP family protein [Pseudomonas sp. UBA2684]|uniref:HPP family protein n=1 Tax=Pseudomonas sp. UBA2684 TaxID=1947311 RepID=UPI0025FB1EBD|nr:HPP family protein [Pseudomonas sp. UBA2684]
MNALIEWLKAFWPAPMAVSRSEQALSCIGAFLALLFTGWLCREALGDASPWLIAPMGASAVLLFAVPASPLAQPWSVIGGNLVAALVGVACASWLGHSGAVAALAGALAIAGMFALRCLHPPGGAVALTAVLAGEEIAQLGYHFALYPVALNSLGLLLMALLFNNALRRRYPHRPVEHVNVHHTADPIPRDRLGFTPEDLDAVLKARGELLDIARDDLEEILLQTETRAYRRRFGEIRCADIMSKDVLSVAPDASVGVALAHLQAHKLSAMPVLGARRELHGMLYLHDLVPATASSAPVSTLMQRQVPSCRADWPITYLVQLLSDSHVHKVPVVDEHKVLLGIVTQSDLVAALFRVSLDRYSAATPEAR